MPIITRSRSRQLKRKRVEIERDAEDPAQPSKKRLKGTSPTIEQKEESDDDYLDEEYIEPSRPSRSSKSSKSTKSKKKKSKKTKAKSKSTKKSKDKSPEDSNSIIDSLKSKHMELRESGYHYIVGVDEAGRGPLAGPVVIAAAYVPIEVRIDGITDSKKINDEEEREKLYKVIMETPEIKYSVTVLDHEVIDEYNILEASMMGMRECVKKLHESLVADGRKGVDYALADGNRDPRFEHPKDLNYEYIIKGDSKVYCIGAASIIAKVQRDRLMEEYHKLYPIYDFAQNKGYPTPRHKALVLSKGPCDIHRKSFRPVKDWYQRHKPEVHEKWDALKKQRAEERKSRLSKNKNPKKDDPKKEKSKSNGKKKKKKGKSSKKKRKGMDEDSQPMIMSFLKTGDAMKVKERSGENEQKELEDVDQD